MAMDEPLPLLKKQLSALRAARATGARSIAFEGRRRPSFAAMRSLRDAIADLERRIDGREGARTVRISTRKGLERVKMSFHVWTFALPRPAKLSEAIARGAREHRRKPLVSARRRLPEGLAPAALNRADAAAYVGVCAAGFDRAVAAGTMPQPRSAVGFPPRWLRAELDAALRRLPYRDGSAASPPKVGTLQDWD